MSSHENNQSVIVFKTWHFVASQIFLFIALFTTMNTITANFDKKYYPNNKGEALETTVKGLDTTMKELNKTLVDLRVMFAEQKGRTEIPPALVKL